MGHAGYPGAKVSHTIISNCQQHTQYTCNRVKLVNEEILVIQVDLENKEIQELLVDQENLALQENMV